MKSITIEFTEQEYRMLVNLLGKIEMAMHPPRKRNSKWVKEGDYIINTSTGRKLYIRSNKFE